MRTEIKTLLELKEKHFHGTKEETESWLNTKWVAVDSVIKLIEDELVDEEAFYEIDYPTFKVILEGIINKLKGEEEC